MDLEYIDLQYLDDISELEEDNNEGKREEIIRVPKRYIRVDGAIDCTHVRLTPTRFQGVNEIYRNRKGYFSLNVQVCSILYKEYYFLEFNFVMIWKKLYKFVNIHMFRLSLDHERNFLTLYQSGQEVSMTVVFFKIPKFTCVT